MHDQYEYKVIHTDYVLLYDKELNEFGQDGWELCVIYRLNNAQFYYCFKRKIVTKKDGE